MAERVRRSKDDDGAAPSPHAPLRHCRNRKRELALQKSRLTSTHPSLKSPRSPRLRNPDQLRRGECYCRTRHLQGVPIRCKSGVPFLCSLTLKTLERENRELRQANEIVRK